MDDQEIIQLYINRSQQAIEETKHKYGSYCKKIARNILLNYSDVEECENDTYLAAWKAIPPHMPRKLSIFLGRITRNIALDRFGYNTAKKRNQEFVQILNEHVGLLKSTSIIDEVSKGKENTIELCSKLLLTLMDYNEKLVIEDDACIVKAGGAIVDWFLDLVHMQSLPSEVVFYVASRYRPNPSFVSESPLMMEYPMSTLHKEDMYSLFKHCLAIHKQQLDEELIADYVDCFTGYPKQAIDAAEIVCKNNELLAKKKIGRIKESYDGNYAPIWDEFTEDCRDLVVLLSKFDFISTQLLLDIYRGKDITSLLEELEPFSLCESFGKTNEYICLSPAFADYIARSRYKMSSAFAKTYNMATKAMLAEIDSELTDISSRLYSTSVS